MSPEEAIGRITAEHDRATKLHGSFQSSHEGYAVILEEMYELWEEVRRRRHKRSREDLTKEATQVAAMAMRFMVDLL